MYLPKTKYKGNLHTAGDLLVSAATGQRYTGYYFETVTGTYYSGIKPGKFSKRLIPIEGSDLNVDQPTKIDYDVVRSNKSELNLKSTQPVTVYYPATPTEKDYRRGSFSRFYALDKTTGQILEIAPEVYASMNAKETKYYYPKYTLLELTWTLFNADINRKLVAKKNLDFPGIVGYIKDYKQFVI